MHTFRFFPLPARCVLPTLAAVLATLAGPHPAGAAASAGEAGDPGSLRPLPAFEQNVGQWNAGVAFAFRGRTGHLLLLEDGSMLLPGPSSTQGGARMRLTGVRKSRFYGEERIRTRIHSLVGSDPSRWRADVPAYHRVRSRNLLPGVDLVYYTNRGDLEYDLRLQPGVDPAMLQLEIEGADTVRIEPSGDLRITRGGFSFVQKRPVAYQGVGAKRREIPAGFEVRAGKKIGFKIGPFDRRRAQVIDPVLLFSSYLGGEGPDQANAVAVDAAGNAYVVGTTASLQFPTFSPGQPANAGMRDVFIARLNRTRTSFVFCTYLGGSGDEFGNAVALTREGRIAVAGSTGSEDFPRRDASQQLFAGGKSDGFLTVLSPQGRDIVSSTFLGGAGDDDALGLAIDPQGRFYLAGSTSSPSLVTGDTTVTLIGGASDAFVARLVPGQRQYFTYVGGAQDDRANAVGVTPDGKAWIAGRTISESFPAMEGVTAPANTGGNGFVSRLKEDGTGLEFLSFLAGSSEDEVHALALDAAGSVYLAGGAGSADFPCVDTLFPYSGGSDAFVLKLNAEGTTTLYSTFIGGSSDDRARAVAVGADGTVYLTGETVSGDFPQVNPLQLGASGSSDAFVVALRRAGAEIEYASYLGGLGADSGRGIGLAPNRRVLVVGRTASVDIRETGFYEGFPLEKPLQSVSGNPAGGLSDAFVLEISPQNLGRLSVRRAVGFGTLRVGAAPVTRRLRLRNTGKGAMTLTIGTPVAPFFVESSPAVIHLLPRQSRTLMLHFDPALPGSFRSTLTITPAGAPRPVPVRLTGRARPNSASH